MADRLAPGESFPTLRETPEEIAYELRAHEGALWTGGRMLIGIWAFAFASLAFAYFYLRSANNDDLWRPPTSPPPRPSARPSSPSRWRLRSLAAYGLWRFRGRRLDWQVAGLDGGALHPLAVGLQIWQLTDLPFFPGSSGYASCFIGWAGMNIVFLLSGGYWLETLARPSAPPAPGCRRGRRHGPLLAARRPSLQGEPRGLHLLLGVHRPRRLFFWALFYVV